MPIQVLSILRIVLLVLLYAFLFRVIRVIAADLATPGSRGASAAPPRPAIARAEPPKTPRRQPRELVVHAPTGSPQVLGLGPDPTVLGRSGRSTIPIDDVFVSDEHAEVRRDGDVWVVVDLGSTNGTFLNGAKVTQPTPLAAGDQVRIGKTRVEVRR